MRPDPALLPLVRALTHVIDAADAHTRGRSARIARWSLAIARELGVPATDLWAIEMGARLHDLGRHALLNDVVQSPRPLDADEVAAVRTHPTVGWEMLCGVPGLGEVAAIVHAHHERPDGRGYPRGLTGDAIPMGARIVMVCAAYDAMTEERPYRHGLPADEACAELQRHRGTQFFPEVVDAFIRLRDAGRLEGHGNPDVDVRAA